MTLRSGGDSLLTVTVVISPQFNTVSVADSSPLGTGVGVLVGQGVRVGGGVGLGVAVNVGVGAGVWVGVGASGVLVSAGMASIVAWTLASTVASTSGVWVGVAVGIAMAMADCTVASMSGVGSGGGGWAQATVQNSSGAARRRPAEVAFTFDNEESPNPPSLLPVALAHRG